MTEDELKQQLDEIQESLNKESVVQKLLKRIDELAQENKQMKSALEEIREIAMGIMDDDIDEGSAYYDADQIISKINEVLQ